MTAGTAAEDLDARLEPAQSDGPPLSIVIVTYNCREHVVACLESLERQRDELEFETLLVDNDSSDGTLEHVRTRFEWVDATSAGGNIGFARANNIALRRARGEYVLLLNPDTVVPQSGLREVIHAIGARPRVGVLGCKLVQLDGSLDHACKRGFPTPANAFAYFARAHRRRWATARMAKLAGQYTAAELGDDEEGAVDAVSGAFMLTRREAFGSVGLLDERFWMYGEDVDWCYRFQAAGWEILYWPGVEVVHAKGGSSGKTRSWRANHAFHRAIWVFYRKHYWRSRPRVVGIAVWTAIWTKLMLSAAHCRLSRLRPNTAETSNR